MLNINTNNEKKLTKTIGDCFNNDTLGGDPFRKKLLHHNPYTNNNSSPFFDSCMIEKNSNKSDASIRRNTLLRSLKEQISKKNFIDEKDPYAKKFNDYSISNFQLEPDNDMLINDINENFLTDNERNLLEDYISKVKNKSEQYINKQKENFKDNTVIRMPLSKLKELIENFKNTNNMVSPAKFQKSVTTSLVPHNAAESTLWNSWRNFLSILFHCGNNMEVKVPTEITNNEDQNLDQRKVHYHCTEYKNDKQSSSEVPINLSQKNIKNLNVDVILNTKACCREQDCIKCKESINKVYAPRTIKNFVEYCKSNDENVKCDLQNEHATDCNKSKQYYLASTRNFL